MFYNRHALEKDTSLRYCQTNCSGVCMSLPLFPQLIVGYWEVFALMGLGYVLHFVPDSWERGCTKTIIRLPLVGKAVLLVALIYLVIQMKSADVQPFIYFQF